jgi:hypothetical protein
MSSRKVVRVFLAVAFIGSVAGNARADNWQVVYQTDFSSDPGWTTNDPTHLGRDPATNTFHGWQSNTNTSYSYVLLPPSFDSSKSFLLEFDAKINSVQWSAGLTFGLWDSSLHADKCITADFSLVDGGKVQGFYATPKSTATYSPQWSNGVWYHNAIEYNATSGLATLITTDRSTGASVFNQSLTGLALPNGYNRLGVSRLSAEGYTTNAVDYNLDNIVLSSVPEPATLLLLALGGLAMMRRRRK